MLKMNHITYGYLGFGEFGHRGSISKLRSNRMDKLRRILVSTFNYQQPKVVVIYYVQRQGPVGDHAESLLVGPTWTVLILPCMTPLQLGRSVLLQKDLLYCSVSRILIGWF